MLLTCMIESAISLCDGADTSIQEPDRESQIINFDIWDHLDMWAYLGAQSILDKV